MTDTNLLRATRLRLAGHPSLGNGWLRERIVNDPSMLGLGNLSLADEGRLHDGRLELLLRDPASGRRFTVLVRVGAAEDADLVRALELWTIERSRYPEHEHFAVVIAEQLPPRFLVAACALGESIPLSVLQTAPLQMGEQVVMHFATVIDRLPAHLSKPINGNGKEHLRASHCEDSEILPASPRNIPRRSRARRGVIFTLISLLSLLVGLATAGAWARSFQHRDAYTFSTSPKRDHVIYSDRGFVEWIWRDDAKFGSERYVKIPYWLPVGMSFILPIAWLARGRSHRFENP